MRRLGHGDAALAWARDRAAALEGLCHPAVLTPDAVGTLADGTVVAAMPRLDGDSLASVMTLRGGLRLGECVTLGIAVADALAAMHRAGLAHGDVAPGNVLVGGDRLWLVDTMLGAAPAEQGTPGFAAPERAAGASAPGDVYALGRVLEQAVRAADAEHLGPWIAPMLHADPAVRPSAALAARALAACAPPAPIDRPAVGVAGALRARAAPGADRTLRRDPPPGWAMRRWLVRRGRMAAWVGAGLAAATLAAAWWGPIVWGAVSAGHTPEAMPGHMSGGVPTRQAPAQAAVDLTFARYGAIVRGDAEALRATTVDGSVAGMEVEGLAQALSDAQVSVRGLRIMRVESRQVAAGPSGARVELKYVLGPHLVVQQGLVTAQPTVEQTVMLDLRWGRQGWQIGGVEAVPGAA